MSKRAVFNVTVAGSNITTALLPVLIALRVSDKVTALHFECQLSARFILRLPTTSVGAVAGCDYCRNHCCLSSRILLKPDPFWWGLSGQTVLDPDRADHAGISGSSGSAASTSQAGY